MYQGTEIESKMQKGKSKQVERRQAGSRSTDRPQIISTVAPYCVPHSIAQPNPLTKRSQGDAQLGPRGNAQPLDRSTIC